MSGIDTVSLSGDGFEAFVSDGDHVRAGEPLLKVDIRKIGDRVPSMGIAGPLHGPCGEYGSQGIEKRAIHAGEPSWKCTGKLTLDFADPECENKKEVG